MKEEKLGNIVEIANKGRRQLKKGERQPGDYPYCGAGGPIENVNTFTHKGDYLLLAAVGNWLGAKKKTAYLMSGKFHADTNVHVLKVSNSVDSKYLRDYLRWMDLIPYAQGTALFRLPTSMLSEIPIMLPSLTEQKQIVKKLEAATDYEKELLMDKIWV